MKKRPLFQIGSLALLAISLWEPLAISAPVMNSSPTVWTLEEVKKIAFENNPDLKSARANYEAASKGISIALSGYLPHVDLYAKFDQTTLPSPSAGATSQLGSSLPYKMATVTLHQTIFDFGKTLSKIGSSRAHSQEAEQEAISVRNAVELAVQRAFYDVQSTAQLIEVAKKGLGTFDETLRRTEVLVRTGAKPQFDLTQAKVEVAKAKLYLISAQNTHDFAAIALLNLMGIEDEIVFTLQDQGTPVEFSGVSAATLNQSNLVALAIQSRPELKKQLFALDASRDDYSGELRNYLPTISLEAWSGRYLPDYPPSIAEAWGVGVVGTWHIFEGFETTFRAAQLSHKIDSQEALAQKDKLAITAEVTRGFKDLAKSEDSLLVANEALDSSKENLYLAQKRYEANVATILELLTAESSLLNSEAVAVTARYDHEISLATLRKAVNAPLKSDQGK